MSYSNSIEYQNQQQFLQHQNLASQQKKLLYIGGLSQSVAGEDDIKNLCSPFGDILNITVPIDIVTKKHRGFAFVEFKSSDDAKQCMLNLHNSILYDRTLTVNSAKSTSIKFKGHTADTLSYDDINDSDNQNRTVAIESAFQQVERNIDKL